MRIMFEISSSNDKITIPLSYNYQIQSLLYNNISPELASFLHDKGFLHERRRFKMFTFSKLIGRYEIKYDKITFTPPVKLIVSSPIDQFISELANTILRKGDLNLCGENVAVEEISVLEKPVIRDRMRIRMMTPVVTYSTLLTPDGKKKTYYYNPSEPEFADIIDKNLRKKYDAFYGREPRARRLSLRPKGRFIEKIVRYRDNIIKGYTGRFFIEGNKKILDLAYESGLGSKNSQGFGMFEIMDEEDTTGYPA